MFGLTILDPDVANPWGIVFPAVADMDNAVAAGLAEMRFLRTHRGNLPERI